MIFNIGSVVCGAKETYLLLKHVYIRLLAPWDAKLGRDCDGL